MIRDAALVDVPALLALGEAMHAESRLAAFPFARARVERLLLGLLTVPNGCLFVAERDGQVIGGFAGWCDLHWACDAKQASDFALFIEPSRRGGVVGRALVRRFKEWSREQRADQVQVGISTGVKVGKTTRLLELEGFEVIGPIMELKG